MLMKRIEPELDWKGLVTVRLLRRWAAISESDHPPLPNLVKLGTSLGVAPEATVALASVFQLTEACLGRPLKAECCCSTDISPDERAVLMMLAVASPPDPPMATREIPHGLPAALAWAVASLRNLLGAGEARLFTTAPDRCPFMAAVSDHS